MGAIDPLSDAVDALTSNPVILVAGALYALVLLPQKAIAAIGIPLIPNVIAVVTFFITPFILAGVIAMAREGLEKGTSLDTFTTLGKKRYLQMLGGSLLQFGITLAFGIALVIGLVILVFVIGIGGAAAAGSDSFASDPSAVVGGLGLVAILGFLGVLAVIFIPFLLFMFVIQFYPQAIVLEDLGPVEAFKRSYGTVRANIVETIVFSLIIFVVGIIAAIPGLIFGFSGGVLQTLAQAGEDPVAAYAGGAGLAVVGVLVGQMIAAIVFPFKEAYATTFFLEHRE